MKTIFNFLALVAVVAGFSVAHDADAQTPVAYWNFDDVYDVDADTTATDSSGNGHNAVWQNANTTPDWRQGVLGGAIRFPNGSDDINAKNYFETAGSITQLADALPLGMSISAWINPDGATGGYEGLVMSRSVSDGISSNLNFGIAIETSGDPADTHIDTRAGGQAVDSAPDSITTDDADVNTLNGWQHVVWAWDNQELAGDNVSVFVNGQLSTSGAAAFGFFSSIIDGGQWAIGTDPGNAASRIFAGLIDDVAIFNTVLDQTDAQSIYDDGVAGMNLVGGTYPAVGQGTTINDILANYRTEVSSRADGDLNFDGFVDASDFRLLKDNAPLSAASANVPEPSSMVLFGVAALCGISLRRQAIRKAIACVMLAVTVVASLDSQALAQDVVLTVNRDTKAITVSNNDAASVDLDLYEIRSASGALDPANGAWTSLFDAGFGLTGWQEANPSTNLLAELNLTATTTLSEAGGVEPSFSLGTPFDPESAKAAAGFGVEVEDLVFVYSGPTIGINTGTVNYVGNKEFNTLVVNVNPASGAIEIENESPFEVTLTSYQISSPAGALDTSWSGIRGSNAAWDAIGTPTAMQLAELEGPTGSGLVVPAAGTVQLGNAYTSGAAQDDGLEFTFGLLPAPQLLGQTEFVGGVKFSTGPTGPGDFDMDTDVDGSDFLLWQRGGSPNGPTAGDLAEWQSNYPAPLAGVGAVSAVPEPGAVALLMTAAAAMLPCRRRR